MTIEKESDLHQRSPPEVLSAEADWDAAAAPSSARYESQGCLLLIGAGTTRIAEILDSLGHQLRPIVLLTDSGNVTNVPQGLTCLQGQLLELSGHLGQFHAVIQGKKNPLNLGLLCANKKACFDLVLDLSSPPHFAMEVPPVGYYAPGNDPEALHHALLELPTLVGTFLKPKFFRYNLARCVHARKGIQGCVRCIQACPTQAVASLQDRVQVDPHLCQGCATCAAVCPTGAIADYKFEYKDFLETLQNRIRSQIEGERRRPVVLFHDSANHHTLIDTLQYDLPSHFITVQLRELAVAGMETWLNALACGAAGIVLLTTKRLPALTRRALQAQVKVIVKLLQGMGYVHERVRMLELDDAINQQNILDADCPDPAIHTTSFHALNDKRRIVEKTLTHLWSQADAPQSSIALDVGASFGLICVDPDACTLCMSCTTVCPTRALRRGGDQAQERLEFLEAFCVQCGICAAACPEDAIALAPRYLSDQKQREQVCVLNEEPAFHCISCGKPYTTKAIVERMAERLQDNPFFQGEALNKLKQCPDCRSRGDILNRFRSTNPPSEN